MVWIFGGWVCLRGHSRPKLVQTSFKTTRLKRVRVSLSRIEDLGKRVRSSGSLLFAVGTSGEKCFCPCNCRGKCHQLESSYLN